MTNIHLRPHWRFGNNRPCRRYFGFSLIHYDPDFVFKETALQEIERIQSTTGFSHEHLKMTTIHFSAIPWLNFTSLSHARSYFPDSSLRFPLVKWLFLKMEKNHAHINSCTPWINGRLTFRTICRLFSRNHESKKHGWKHSLLVKTLILNLRIIVLKIK
jgi:hypothetical protein